MKKATKKKVAPPPRTRNIYITPKQFLKLPLSQAILQVIEDVKLIQSEGIGIHMNMWWQTGDDNKKPCAVCLGGAAICSFAPDKVNGYNIEEFGRRVLRITQHNVYKIATTFDSIRMGHLNTAARNWYGENRHFSRDMQDILDDAPLEFEYLSGSIEVAAMNRFLKKLEKFAYRLQAVGY